MVSSAIPPPLPWEDKAPPPRRRRGKFWIILGSLVLGVPLVLVTGLGLAIEFGMVPDSKVAIASEIDDAIRAAVNEHVPLEEGERILFFYSAGIFSYDGDGNVLTNRRAITWSDEGGETSVGSLAWEDIVTVQLEQEGSFFEDELLYFEDRFGDWMYLWFSVEEDRNELAWRYANKQIGER